MQTNLSYLIKMITRTILLAGTLLLLSCDAQPRPLDPIKVAQPYVGMHEEKDTWDLVQILKVNPIDTPWCAAFVNNVLLESNALTLDELGLNPLLARSFLNWGDPVEPDDIQYGDIVVFPRDESNWKGHVGFYTGDHPVTGEWIILGGNQDDEVSYEPYNKMDALGVRRWKGFDKTI